MDNGNPRELAWLHNREWNRKIINSLWAALFFYVSIDAANLLLFNVHGFPIHELSIYPIIWMMILAAAAEGAYQTRVSSEDIITLLSATLICGIIIWYNPSQKVFIAIFMLPIYSSVIFLKKRKVLLISFISIAIVWAAYLWNGQFAEHYSLGDMANVVILYAFVVYTALKILDRFDDRALHIKELLLNEQKLLAISKTDSLTGLYNHRAFQEYIETVVETEIPAGKRPLLAVLDLDFFKQINDTFGHAVGDKVLMRAASCILDHITVDDFAARYGGEEFVIVFMNKNGQEALDIAERIREQVANLRIPELGDTTVTISIGLQLHRDDWTKLQWFEQADVLLYQAKRSGRNVTMKDMDE